MSRLTDSYRRLPFHGTVSTSYNHGRLNSANAECTC